MNPKIDIRVEIDPTRSEPRVVIQTAETTELVENLIYAIERYVDNEYSQIAAEDEGTLVMLNQWDIFRLHTENRKVVIHTATGRYETRTSLQDIEKNLDPDCFVRISRFEIINLNKVDSFSFPISGYLFSTMVPSKSTAIVMLYLRLKMPRKPFFLGSSP